MSALFCANSFETSHAKFMFQLIRVVEVVAKHFGVFFIGLSAVRQLTISIYAALVGFILDAF
jgi:hypothetical protein